MRSGLFRILRTFSKGEIRSFEKFLSSSYHRSEKNCLPVFKEFKKFYPEFKPGDINYENVYNSIYPGKKYNKQVMWNLVSALEKNVMNFLETESFRKDKFQAKEMRINELLNRKLSEDALHEIETMENFFEGSLIGFNYLRYRIRQGDSWINYIQAENRNHLLPDFHMENMEYQVLNFLKMLKASLEDQLFFKEMFNKKFEINLPRKFAESLDLGSVIEYCEKNNFRYLFYIKIIYHSIMIILENDDTEHFFKLKKLFDENHHRFERREKRNLIIPMVNFCVRKKYSAEHNYSRIMFELNGFRLKEGLAFYPDNQIPKLLYTQILLNAISLGELTWAKEFAENYTKMLHPEIRSSMGALAIAFLNFEDKKYYDVLKNLNEVNYTDVRDKLHVRMLTAKTYYELGETETLLSYIDSSKHFLQNNLSINETKKKIYANLFTSLLQLLNLRSEKNEAQIKTFRESVINSGHSEYSVWILKKTDELLR